MCSEMQSTQVCTKCGVEKPHTEEFFCKLTNAKGKTYLKRYCKTCNYKYSVEMNRVYRYGVERKQFEELLIQQNHQCHICERKFGKGRKSSPNLDHDHKTGRVRGLLCTHCNVGLGMFGDNPVALTRAAKYLCEDIV